MDSYCEESVLLVDDEENFLMSSCMTLNSARIFNVAQCSDASRVMKLLESNKFSVVLLDMIMPETSGMELLPKIVENFPDVMVIVITALDEIETAVKCMKYGVFDYLVKPVDDTRLVQTVRNALKIQSLKKQNTSLKQSILSNKLQSPKIFEGIVTQNNTMHSIFQYMEAISETPMPALITGETGVGKEVFAETLHKLSKRPGKFVAVNIAGLDQHLFADTLFGHIKGAFTGADKRRSGVVEQADQGTLFLDEIGDMCMDSQVKLLRLLQEGKYYPLGSDVPKSSNVRIIAATNQDLQNLISQGKFRKDLFYRLQTHHICIPPLRQRVDDLPLLIEHFLAKSSQILGKKKPTCPKELYILLENYGFPGNIRELEAMIFDAVSRHKKGLLSTESFRTKITNTQSFEKYKETEETLGKISFTKILPTLKEMERLLIQEALDRAKGNQKIAAQTLGLSRRALNNRLSREKQI